LAVTSELYLSKPAPAGSGQPPIIIPRPDHSVSRANISKNALKVLYRLKDAGFQAFLVGGAVRDLLLGLRPKDFDVATDADPDQVRDLFRNSRLIGRRFRLAHVRFGRDIIEVATFRASADETDERADVELDQHGRILRDNVYGSIDEDVWRRDFTANALYYNIADFSIWDYVGGARDIEERVLRLIGDPEQRLREDPVRMLRAVRFAAKLDFTIHDEVAELMPELSALLAHVPAARLFDEFVKMFQAGHARRTFELLLDHGLFGRLFPDTRRELDGSVSARFREFIALALANTDQRVAEGKAVTPMFLLGVFLWAPVRARAAEMLAERKMGEPQALGIAAGEVVARQQSLISIPKRFAIPMREMLALQPRFDRRRGKRAMSFLEHRRFRAAYDFMLLRSRIGEVDPEVAAFWTEVQEMSGEERAGAFEVRGSAGGGNRSGQGGDQDSGNAEGKKSGRRRRPRRRKRRDSGD